MAPPPLGPLLDRLCANHRNRFDDAQAITTFQQASSCLPCRQITGLVA